MQNDAPLPPLAPPPLSHSHVGRVCRKGVPASRPFSSAVPPPHPPYISLPPPVFLHELPTHDLESDESLRDLGLRVVWGVGQSKEFEHWYTILLDSCGTQPVAVWDLLSNANSREECLADPKLHDSGVLGLASLPLCWGGTP